MREQESFGADDPVILETTAYELVPQLAANEAFIAAADELRRLKLIYDQYFNKRGKLPSVFDALKHEVAALAAVAGLKSVAYIDMRVTNADGGETQGKVTGAGIMNAASGDLAPEQIRAIALAAVDVDPAVALQHGISPMLLEAGRERGKPRAGSVRVDLIGGKSAPGGSRGSNSGPVQ